MLRLKPQYRCSNHCTNFSPINALLLFFNLISSPCLDILSLSVLFSFPFLSSISFCYLRAVNILLGIKVLLCSNSFITVVHNRS